MNETLITIFEYFQVNWYKILLVLTTPIIGGLSAWQIFAFFIKLVKNNTAKKYFQPLKENYNEIKVLYNDLSTQMLDIFNKLKEENVDTIKRVIAEFMASYESVKQQIYNDIVNSEEIKVDNQPQIDLILETKEETTGEEMIVDNPSQIDIVETVAVSQEPVEEGELL